MIRHPQRLLSRPLLLLLALGVSLAPALGDPFQTWYQAMVFHRFNERWAAGSYFDLRFNDSHGDPFVLMASPRVKYDLNRNWFAMVSTTYLRAGNPAGDPPVEHFRLELELNPRYHLSQRWVLSSRNRFEFRWMEGVSERNERIRLRPQVDFLTPGLGPVRGLFANNEVFLDFDQSRVTENRLIPFGLSFQPHKTTELRVYYLWRHTLFRNQWHDFHVLGVLANVNF